jgi:hypothetical protein
MKKVKFMSVARVHGLMFNPARPSGIKLRRSGHQPVTATLTPSNPETDPFGHRQGLECKLSRSYPINESIFRFIDRLNSRVFTPYPAMTITLPHRSSRGELIATDGAISEGYRLPFKHFPDELKTLCNKSSSELSFETRRFLNLITWFFNTSHVHNPVDHVHLYWNTRGRVYHAVSLPEDEPSGYWQNDVVWNEENEHKFVSLWKTASVEPLAHELFREAGSLLHSAPRSALLMLANALEAGVKNYIGQRAPVTQWLLTEVPSPPIKKILQKFIPTMNTYTTIDLSQWAGLTKMFNRIEQRITDRNHLTHRGTMECNQIRLIEFKDDVSDVLYILDYLNGEHWARDNVRPETCQLLGWPNPVPIQTGFRATIKVLKE